MAERGRNVRVLGTLLLLSCYAAWAQSGEPDTPVQEITVVGQHAGPQMWRLTRGDHVVWILGTMEVLPKKMTWDSREVERVLGEVQELISDDFSVTADIGFFSAVRLYLQFRNIEVLKDKRTLKEVLTPELYARFSALRARYGNGPKDMERMRPLFAADRLYEEAIEKTGLTRTTDVRKLTLKLAKRHHVKIHKLQLQVQDPRSLLQEVEDLSIPQQSGCLEPVVSTLEKDMGVLAARANAWARGDVPTLLSLPIVNREAPCSESVAGAHRLSELAQQMHKLWLDAVENALSTNRNTLVVGSIDHLLGTQGSAGALAELRAAGYTIEGPDLGSSRTGP
jgi:uncharacterized protein YbaP (TraB family)